MKFCQELTAKKWGDYEMRSTEKRALPVLLRVFDNARVTAGGTAYVLVQKEIRSNQAIRAACHGNNEYYGGIGIYFPNLRHCRFLYHSYAGQDEALLNKVCKCVLQYSNAQQMPLLYTWDGMNCALLMDQLAHQKQQTKQARAA